MKVSSETKISALIRENPAAIEAIISVSPRFSKLRNPLLRGILASRTSLEDAARIGKCDIGLLFKALEAIGFETGTVLNMPEEISQKAVHPAIKEAIRRSRVTSLDVRPTLDRGGDPFNEIMGELALLPEEFALQVINSFEPTPLINIARNKGFESWVDSHYDDEVHTYFIKVGDEKEENPQDEWVFEISFQEHEKRLSDFMNEIRYLDVRDLEMPLPMITILKELEDLDEKSALYVHHKKIPRYLLPELRDRNFRVWITTIDDENVKLLIHR